MKRITIEKIAVTTVLTIWWACLPMVGYDANDFRDANVGLHLAYMLSHANIWHLLGNLFVLWLFRNKLYLLPSLIIAFLCSFLPVVGIWPMGVTVGFSGVLFAIAGIKWGVYCRQFVLAGHWFEREALAEFSKKALPFAVLGIFIPHVNWCLHLYCLLAGFVYGRYNRN